MAPLLTSCQRCRDDAVQFSIASDRPCATRHRLRYQNQRGYQRTGRPLQSSKGIATGYARVGDDGKVCTAIGDVVILSARFLSKAGACEVLINDECELVAPHACRYAGLEEATLKGFRDPVQGPLVASSRDGPPGLPDDPAGGAFKQCILLTS
jgi:class 3 adenylate cyclase